MRAFVRAALALAAVSGGPALAADSPRIVVENGRFELLRGDRTKAPQSDLIGAVITLGDGAGKARRLRIDAVEPDPMDRAGEMMLYTLTEQVGANGAWENICEPDAQGRRAAFPLTGRFTATVVHVDQPDRVSILCTAGAEGKCVRFGYKPWGHAPDGSSLAPYYQTCLRLVRADYCGDGVGHTRDGTPIDIFDRKGIQNDEIAPGMSFEAAFAADGAVCVAHPRLPAEASLERLVELCPKLAGRVGPTCNDTSPGLLFVRSYGK
ncbi:MAG: ADYC domain-containing protein [Roseiarcus sp.]